MIALVVAACLAGVAGEPGGELHDGGVVDEVSVEAEPEAAVGEADAGVAEVGASAGEGAPLPADAPLSETEKRDVRPEFVKGELSVYLGSDRLTGERPPDRAPESARVGLAGMAGRGDAQTR
jgi:hypothetical protein